MHSTIIVWRHGRTQWNAEQRWQGQTDIELDDIGLEQARISALAIAELNPSRIISSDLKRAFRTASFLAEATGLPITVDERLRETDGGQWEGLTLSDIQVIHADYLDSWRTDMSLPAGVTGETRGAVAKRVSAAIREHVETVGHGTLVVATHGGAARSVLSELLNMPEEVISAFQVMHNCAWMVLDHDDVRGAWRIKEYNVSASKPLVENHI